MNKPHKHAEVIKAWADGAEVELLVEGGAWTRLVYRLTPSFWEHLQYRVYDPLREYKEAYARGEKIEGLVVCTGVWVDIELAWRHGVEGRWSYIQKHGIKVRIAPKPDYTLECDTIICGGEVDLRVTFDGTTGKPKSVELVK